MKKLKKAIVARGTTIQWLANQLGVDRVTVSRWANDKVELPSRYLTKIAELLNVEIKDLIK